MNKKIVSDLIDIKHEIVKEVSQHLSPEAGERIKRLEYDFMMALNALNEATKEFLDKTEKPEIAKDDKEQVKNISVE